MALKNDREVYAVPGKHCIVDSINAETGLNLTRPQH